jgi:hypothetical protein
VIAPVAAWLLMFRCTAQADGLVDGAKQIIEVRPFDNRKGIPKPAAENIQILLRQETHGYNLGALMHVFFQQLTSTGQRREGVAVPIVSWTGFISTICNPF